MKNLFSWFRKHRGKRALRKESVIDCGAIDVVMTIFLIVVSVNIYF